MKSVFLGIAIFALFSMMIPFSTSSVSAQNMDTNNHVFKVANLEGNYALQVYKNTWMSGKGSPPDENSGQVIVFPHGSQWKAIEGCIENRPYEITQKDFRWSQKKASLNAEICGIDVSLLWDVSQVEKDESYNDKFYGCGSGVHIVEKGFVGLADVSGEIDKNPIDEIGSVEKWIGHECY